MPSKAQKGDKRLGNQFWKARSKSGRGKIFKTPKSLWKAAEEYFQWVEDNPLKESKATQFQGKFVYGEVNKMRAMTIVGFCRFVHINFKTWQLYQGRKDFIHITGEIEDVIYDQKFSGAAADLLNANIIARDLGLTEKTSTEHSGTINLTNLTDAELEAKKKQVEQALKQSTQD